MDMSEVIRIDKKYVGTDCAQLMFSYSKQLWILEIGKEPIFFTNSSNKNEIIINKYVNDSRRLSFPFYNVPVHQVCKRLDKIIKANVLLDFNKEYLVQCDFGEYSTIKVKKTNDGAVVIVNSMNYSNRVSFCLNNLKDKIIGKLSSFKSDTLNDLEQDKVAEIVDFELFKRRKENNIKQKVKKKTGKIVNRY